MQLFSILPYKLIYSLRFIFPQQVVEEDGKALEQTDKQI